MCPASLPSFDRLRSDIFFFKNTLASSYINKYLCTIITTLRTILSIFDRLLFSPIVGLTKKVFIIFETVSKREKNCGGTSQHSAGKPVVEIQILQKLLHPTLPRAWRATRVDGKVFNSRYHSRWMRPRLNTVSHPNFDYSQLCPIDSSRRSIDIN